MHSRPHRCSTNSRAAAVMLASGQRTSMVSSYQNHASPQPHTAASHCGLDNVSNAKKYKKSHSAFWESQDIVHTVTFRGAMVVSWGLVTCCGLTNSGRYTISGDGVILSGGSGGTIVCAMRILELPKMVFSLFFLVRLVRHYWRMASRSSFL